MDRTIIVFFFIYLNEWNKLNIFQWIQYTNLFLTNLCQTKPISINSREKQMWPILILHVAGIYSSLSCNK